MLTVDDMYSLCSSCAATPQWVVGLLYLVAAVQGAYEVLRVLSILIPFPCAMDDVVWMLRYVRQACAVVVLIGTRDLLRESEGLI